MSDQHDFDDLFRRWAGRPPTTSAPDAARTVVGRLSAWQRLASTRRQGEGAARSLGTGTLSETRRRARLSPAWTTLAAAALVLVAVTASFIRSLPPAAVAPAKATAPTMVPARNADVVLWLDDGTPVYVFLPDGN